MSSPILKREHICNLPHEPCGMSAYWIREPACGPHEVLSLSPRISLALERQHLVPKGLTRAARRTLPLTENALRVLQPEDAR